jgi:hypothetical protein
MMKKLIIAGALSIFAVSTAAHACDGMKAQQGDSQTQAAKSKAKDGKAKKETGAETNKS